MPEQYQSHLLEINDVMSEKGFDNAAKAEEFIVIIAESMRLEGVVWQVVTAVVILIIIFLD